MLKNRSVLAARPRAIITGICGFTGPHLARLLVSQGLDVVGVDRAAPTRALDELRPRVAVENVDLCDGAALEGALKRARPDYIFHLACQCKSDDPAQLWASNVLATENLLWAAARSARHAKIFVPGSAAEIGIVRPDELPITESQPLRPISLYGLTKAAQILRVLAYGYTSELQVFVGRPFNLVGPDLPDAMVCAAIASQLVAIERGRRPAVIRVACTTTERDFVDVRDAVQAYWAIVTRGRAGEVYNVCGGRGTRIEGVVTKLVRLATVPVEVRVEAARVRRDDIPRSIGDPSKLRSETGWRPEISLEDSLVGVMESWRARRTDGLACA